MNYIIIKQEDGYIEYPVRDKMKIGDEKIETYDFYKWEKTQSEICYLVINDKYKKYNRKEMITIASQHADINISNCEYKILIEGNKIFISIEDGKKGQNVFFNTKKLELEEVNTSIDFDAGDILLLEDIKIVLGVNDISIYANEDSYNSTLLEIKNSKLRFEGFPFYKRSPRLIKTISTDTIDIGNPPEKSHVTTTSLLQMIIPPLLLLGITIAFSIFMKRGAYVVISAATTILSTVFSITKYINEKKDCKEKDKKRRKLYDEYLLRKRKEINEAKLQEVAAWHYNNPSITEIEELINHYSSRIYERNLNDDDFLTVSVGKVREMVSFKIKVNYDELKIDQDDLAIEAKEIKDSFSYIDDKSVVIDLKKAHLGIVGEKENIHEQIKLIISQLTFQQSYHDLQVITIFDSKYNEDFEWMKWYPHLKIRALNVSGSVNSERMRDQVLGSLNQIIKDRKLKMEESKKESRFSPHFLFVIDEPKMIMDHSIMEYLDKEGDNLGFSIIYTTHLRANLPENIGTVLVLEDSKQGMLLLNEKKLENKRLNLERVGNVNLEWMARNLSVLVHEQGVSSHIPESITFFEMYGINKPEELGVRDRWTRNESHKTLAVPLGVRAENDYVYLNLHEKAHGPHGLVAGTTGSGKSEIIQSYILSLAVNFHPYEVGFLLIDYKGGGMAGLFKDLPHLLGTITNLDGSESLRAMASIKSELARRQRIFSENNVNHINSYNKLFKTGKVSEPIPHLFLISDEFAELKKEQPDFMKELVSTARIGRSLGIHLILATQKPTGVVDDQIWTNSKFKLALKVQNEADSREILKTPDAAFITQAGRSYLQVGNNETYELFQSAWSGASFYEEGKEKENDDRVYLLNDLGQGELLNEDLSGPDDSNQLKATQLDVTIDYLHKVFALEGKEQVKRPWLPSLPHKIISPVALADGLNEWNKVTKDKNSKIELSFALGMVDIPEEQLQEEYQIDLLKNGNVAYFASSGYGKTTMIMTSLLSLAFKNPVELLNFYILDFGNSALIPLNGLPHTADYMTFDDSEKMGKFIRIIQEEIKNRKRLLAEKMVQNFDVYNQVADKKLKAIIIAIDNYDVVKELGLDVEEVFTKISRDGAGLGIYMIIAGTRSGSVRYATINNFKTKIAGFNFDEGDITTTVGRSSYKIPEIKGRALVNYKNINLMQMYSMVDFNNEVEYSENIKKLIGMIVEKYPNVRAPRIPILPERFSYDMIHNYEEQLDAYDIPLGLDMEAVELRGLKRQNSPFIIVGETAKGKTNMLKVILNEIDKMSKVFLFDSKAMGLYSYQGNNNIEYIQDEEDFSEFVESIEDICEERQELLKESIANNQVMLPKDFFGRLEPIYIIIDEVDDFIEKGKPFEKTLLELVKKAAECGVIIISTTNAGKLKGYDDLSKWFKSTVNGLLLSNQGTLNIFTVSSMREYPNLGIGLLFNNGVYIRIKLPRCE